MVSLSQTYLPETLAALSEPEEKLSPLDEVKKNEIVQGGDSVFHYPLWWTPFVCFLREGENAKDALKRACPDLAISDNHYAVKAFKLLRNPVFRDWLKRIEDGTISEIDKWKRDSFHRVKKLQRVIDKSTSDVMKPKDIQAIAGSEKILHEMGNRVLGIKNEDAPVQVQVNMSNILAELAGSAKEIPAEAIEVFTQSNDTDARLAPDPRIEQERQERLAKLKFPESKT